MLKRICMLLAVVLMVSSVSIADASSTAVKEDSVTISFLGDVCFASNFGAKRPYHDMYAKQGTDFFFKNVLPIFGEDDLTVANLENVFTDNTRVFKKKIYSYRSSVKYIDVLKHTGIDVYNLVNNHMHDYGQKSFDETMGYLNKMGIEHFGYSKPSKTDTDELGWITYDKTYVFEKNGIKVGFIGYMGFTVVYAPASKVAADVKALKEQGADYIVAYTHWGGQNTSVVTARQKAYGKLLVDNGVDLVIGSHPHVLQKMEVYKDKRIYYSLGDFFAVATNSGTIKDTVAVSLRLTKVDGKVTPLFEHIYVNGSASSKQVQLVTDKARLSLMDGILGK